jgi:adenylate kinase
MIIFSTAVAGSNRVSIEGRVAQLAKAHGKRLRIINLVDEMLEVARGLNGELTPNTLLNLDRKVLEVIKLNALHKINDRIKSTPGTDYIIDGHTAFWWKSGPSNLLDVSDFREIKPDFFITVIATAPELEREFRGRGRWKEAHIDLHELLLWSELEIYTADLISKTLGKKNYLIGLWENPLTLYNLLYHRDMIKVYISFSMSYNKDEGYKSVERFVNRLRRIAIVFDPKSVDFSSYKGYKNGSRIMQTAANQTVRLDYHLIDQSDIVVIHLSGLAYSSGVDSERMHAHSTGKKVFLYFPFSKYSPFTPYFVDRMYNKESKLLEKVRQLASEMPRKGRRGA